MHRLHQLNVLNLDSQLFCGVSRIILFYDFCGPQNYTFTIQKFFIQIKYRYSKICIIFTTANQTVKMISDMWQKN